MDKGKKMAARAPLPSSGGGTGPVEDLERRPGPVRGPTKDYREFKGEFKGRLYRFYRIMWTNLKHMVRTPWSIVVMVISFLFVFFHILTLAFGGGQEELLEQFADLDPEVHFRLEPVEGQPGKVPVSLGETYRLSYSVRNTGNDGTSANFLFFLPNENWESDHWIEGDRSLSRGESLILHVNVTVPDSVEAFSSPGAFEPFRDLGGPGFLGGEVIIYSEPYSDERRIPVDEPVDTPNAVYRYNISRLIGVACVPEQLMEDIEQWGFDIIDVRLRSIGTMLTLDPDDPEVREELDLSGSTDVPSFRIWLGKDEGEVFRTKMEAPEIEEFTVNIENTGRTTVVLDLDCFIMPMAEPTWTYQWIYEEDPISADPLVEVAPGERTEITLILLSGEFPYKAHYAILVTATDVSNSTYQASNAYHMTVSVTGSSYAPPEPGERYHQIFWGGGFYYERYLWLILLAAFVGSGIIGRDLEENSISLYLSRPVTWYDYLLAKFSSLFLLLSTITVLPAVVLFMTGMAFSNRDLPYIFDHLHILFGMVFSYVIALVLFSSVSMAFSTLIRKWIFSGVAIFVFFIFTSTVSDVLVALFENDHLRMFNLNFVMKNLFRPLFGLEYSGSETGVPYTWLIAVMALVTALSWFFVISRFRNKEVAR